MSNKKQRLILFHLNKYQKALCIPIVIAFIIGCIVSWSAHFYFSIYNMHTQNPTVELFRVAFPWILITAVFVMFSLFIGTCYYTNKLLGPFERIRRELDEILDGKRDQLGDVRKGDIMFEQLTGRINQIIKNKK